MTCPEYAVKKRSIPSLPHFTQRLPLSTLKGVPPSAAGTTWFQTLR